MDNNFGKKNQNIMKNTKLIDFLRAENDTKELKKGIEETNQSLIDGLEMYNDKTLELSEEERSELENNIQILSKALEEAKNMLRNRDNLAKLFYN